MFIDKTTSKERVGENGTTKVTWTDTVSNDDIITKKSQMGRSYADVVRGKV